MAEEKGQPQNNVKVAVRCRPLSRKELNEGSKSIVTIENGTVALEKPESTADPSSFRFDFVYPLNTTQDVVFRDLGAPLLDTAFAGFNGTIFAYGQTGAGKTHSMSGSPSDPGIIPRMCDALFERIRGETAASPNKKFLVVCSFFEIYNEIIKDLLNPAAAQRGQKAKSLQIKENAALGIYVHGLQEVVVDSENKIAELMEAGHKNRTVGATLMNAQSSRSHSIFTMKIHQKDVNNPKRNVFAKINLVDLAGSERASRTEASGARLKEGANINKSLSALGNVINALAESAKASGKRRVFIPYRNSKLTRVLQESLGGNSLCCMLAALSPAASNHDETLGTLKYANRAKSIKVNATKNEEVGQLDKLKDEIKALKQKLTNQTSAAARTGMDEEEKRALAEKYESQIRDIDGMLRQTWEDKEAASQQFENERRLMQEQADEEKRAMREEVERERASRRQQLLKKGDVESYLRECGAPDGVTTGWLRMVTEGRRWEQQVKEQRMVAMVYKDAFDADIARLPSLPTTPSLDVSAESAVLLPSGSGDPDRDAAAKTLLEQAQSKLNTFKDELNKLWSLERRNTKSTAALSDSIRTLLGLSSENAADDSGGEPSPSIASDPEPVAESVASITPEVAAAMASEYSALSVPLPSLVSRTKQTLAPLLPSGKPKLSEKMLSRPPFQFLVDVFAAVAVSTGFGAGLFPEEGSPGFDAERKALAIAGGSDEKFPRQKYTREQKSSYLSKVLRLVGLARGCALRVAADRVMAGVDCELTNLLLLELVRVAQAPGMDHASLIQRVNAEEQPAPPPPPGPPPGAAPGASDALGAVDDAAPCRGDLSADTIESLSSLLSVMDNKSAALAGSYKKQRRKMLSFVAAATPITARLEYELGLQTEASTPQLVSGDAPPAGDGEAAASGDGEAASTDRMALLSRISAALSSLPSLPKLRGARALDCMAQCLGIALRCVSARVSAAAAAAKESRKLHASRTAQLELEVSALREKEKQLSTELADSRSAVSSLTLSLSAANTEAASLQARLQEESSKKESALKAAAAASSQRDEQAAAVQEARAQLDTNASQLSDTAQRLEQATRNCKELQETNKGLVTQLSASADEGRAALATAQADLASVKDSLQQTLSRAEKAERERTEATEREDTTRQTLTAISALKDAATTALQAATTRAEESEAELRVIRTELTSQATARQQAEERVVNLEAQLTEATAAAARTLDDAQRRAEADDDRHRAETNTEVERVRAEFAAQLSSQESSLVELRSQGLRLQAAAERADARAEAAEERLVEVESDMEAAAAKSAEQQALIEELREAASENTNVIEVLTEERDSARATEEQYFYDLKETQAELDSIQMGYVELSDRLNDKVDEILELQEQVERWAALAKAPMTVAVPRQVTGSVESDPGSTAATTVVTAATEENLGESSASASATLPPRSVVKIAGSGMAAVRALSPREEEEGGDNEEASSEPSEAEQKQASEGSAEGDQGVTPAEPADTSAMDNSIVEVVQDSVDQRPVPHPPTNRNPTTAAAVESEDYGDGSDAYDDDDFEEGEDSD